MFVNSGIEKPSEKLQNLFLPITKYTIVQAFGLRTFSFQSPNNPKEKMKIQHFILQKKTVLLDDQGIKMNL